MSSLPPPSSSFRDWTFSVTLPPTSTDEVVCVTGSVPALGQWGPDDIVRMKKKTAADEEESGSER